MDSGSCNKTFTVDLLEIGIAEPASTCSTTAPRDSHGGWSRLQRRGGPRSIRDRDKTVADFGRRTTRHSGSNRWATRLPPASSSTPAEYRDTIAALRDRSRPCARSEFRRSTRTGTPGSPISSPRALDWRVHPSHVHGPRRRSRSADRRGSWRCAGVVAKARRASTREPGNQCDGRSSDPEPLGYDVQLPGVRRLSSHQVRTLALDRNTDLCRDVTMLDKAVRGNAIPVMSNGQFDTSGSSRSVPRSTGDPRRTSEQFGIRRSRYGPSSVALRAGTTELADLARAATRTTGARARA